MHQPGIIHEKLNIAILVRSFSTKGGLELYTYKLVEGLLNKGFYITVICEESSDELHHNNLQIEKISQPQKCSKSQKLLHYLKHTDECLARLGKFDLVHSQHFPTTKADVVTFHNQTVEQLSRVGYKWEQVINNIKRMFIPAYKLRWEIDRLLCRNASCLIFPAEVMHKDFDLTYMVSTPYVIAHPGASLAQGSHTNSIYQDRNPFSFLFVGRGYRKKGLDVLLKACVLLKQKNHNFQLFIAGLSAKWTDKIRLKLSGLENNVLYLGFQHNMADVYSKASVFVMPSKMEPFGMAAVQAMQFGLVPIVSKVSGVSEVLTDSKDALILEDHLSAKELASLMTQLMNNPNLLSQLCSESQKTAKLITWDKTVQSTIKAYSIALEAKSSKTLTI